MNETPVQLIQPLAYRVWDPRQRSFFYTDVRPEPSALLDRWTGYFDKQGAPIYEGDILRVHYDWKWGWIRVVVTRHETRPEYLARAAKSDDSCLQIGFYDFADAFRIGNIRQHPHKLTAPTEQFSQASSCPWWLRPAVFRAVPGSCLN